MIVVTGVDGFVGRHVAALAHERGIEVHGVTRCGLVDDDPLHRVLTRTSTVDLREQAPDLAGSTCVVHLAGIAAVGASFGNPQEYIAAHSEMATSLFEAQLVDGGARRFVLVSTGAVYRASDAPIGESAAVEASSPYAVSKLVAELQAMYYRSRGIDAVIARPFNHIGPGQRSGFIVPDLVRALRALAPGDSLRVGNLTTRRDYLDVRDVAAAYLAISESEQLAPLYNIASGAARSGIEILTTICAEMGREIPQLETDPEQMRPTDIRVVVGDSSALRRDTGWRPVRELRQSVADAIATDRVGHGTSRA